jgi:hypothetical protein
MAACRRTGAIAVLWEGLTDLADFPAACRTSARRIQTPAMPGMGRTTFPMNLVYIPPEGDARCPAR